MTWPPRASTRLFRSARECRASTVRHTPARSIPSMTGPMTVVSFVLRSTPRWAALSRVPCQKNPRCWGASWPLSLAPRDALPSAPRCRAGRGRGGDRDAAEGGAGREFRASAGDGLRRGGDRGRGGFPLPPGGLAGLLVRQLAGSPLPPGGLAGPGLRLAGLVPAAFLQPGRGQDPARGGQLARPAAQQVIGQVVIAQARDPPDRLLRRGDVDPRPLVPRASQRPEYPLRAARRPFPGRGERVAPGQPRGHRDRDHARQAEPHAPRVPRVRQLAQPVPQGARTGREHWSGSDRLDGQRSHLPDEISAIPVLPGLRCSSPARHAGIRQILLISRGHPWPAGGRTRTAYPARQPPETARRIWSRNATSLKASLVTHRYIHFAGTLDSAGTRFRAPNGLSRPRVVLARYRPTPAPNRSPPCVTAIVQA